MQTVQIPTGLVGPTAFYEMHSHVMGWKIILENVQLYASTGDMTRLRRTLASHKEEYDSLYAFLTALEKKVDAQKPADAPY